MQLLTVINMAAQVGGAGQFSGLQVVTGDGQACRARLLGVEVDGTVWWFDDNDWHRLTSEEDGVFYHLQYL